MVLIMTRLYTRAEIVSFCVFMVYPACVFLACLGVALFIAGKVMP